MPSIIYPPTFPLNWMVQRPHHILQHLAQLGYHVYYEDPGKFSKPSLKEIFPNFYLCQGTSPLKFIHSYPCILWLTLPSQVKLIQAYQPDMVIYDASDAPEEEFQSWAPYVPKLLDKADLVFASSQIIYEQMSTLHPKTYLIRNGVDFTHFSSPTPVPHDIPIDKPIVGYCGAIAPWLDWELISFLANNDSSLTFLFIGALVKLNSFPLQEKNITYLGMKPYSLLPSYVQKFSVGIIPFRITSMTNCCNPVKLYEYYAAGIPVISTPLPELFAVPGIRLESNPINFSLQLHDLIQQRNSKSALRQSYAYQNDWKERTKEISRKIEAFYKAQSGSNCNTLSLNE